MRANELNYILKTMLDSQEDVSDLIMTVGKPLQVESSGELVKVGIEPDIERLTPFQSEIITLNLIGGMRRLTEDLLRTGSCDSSYFVPGSARFRVNLFSQRGNFSCVLRKLTTEIPTLEQLKLPPIFADKIAKEKTGLVLVTGSTGSGKSTTLAALLNYINETKSVHVVTLEDPVEFVHPQKKATFNQREMGTDFDAFSSGLRAALRQAPKVILVGEMRDRITVELGLSAAETGHLVMSTLHTIDAGQTINRILGMFDTDEQEQVRLRLADTLRWIVCQRLAPRVGGGRKALLEIMGASLRTKDSIVQGEAEGRSFYEIIEASSMLGWCHFDMACVEAYKEGAITEENAALFCTKKGVVSRLIDRLKTERGEATAATDELKLREDTSSKPASSSNGGPNPVGGGSPMKLKLK
jgi:twitching motility protein PilT